MTTPKTDTTDDDTAQALEQGRLLFAKQCDFVLGATNMNQVPVTELPEIAFAGRSNVGKSSLVNALTGRNTLARTSNTPGRTREVNFFNLGGRLMLADLPGYGYARAPKTEIDKWTTLIEDYLRGRVGLRRACLLVDARHGIKTTDNLVMQLLDQTAVVYQIVLTKCDKVKKDMLQARIGEVEKELAKHTAAHPDVIATSARKDTGIAEVRAALTMLAAPEALD
ncbi:MAG: ribosome biogenesis GTP-binding protein YihA/YsxC [Proteobacteria bacterium]|nr:ribosome biogenesis GTP-binding protein YihA/YsxC [Pseudomonadota bacterium]